MEGNEDSPGLLSSSAEELDKACRASARKYAKRSIRLGLIFHGAQQEAYESWVELDQWADAQEGA